MKKLLLSLLLIPTIANADVVTPGQVGLLIVTTGTYDSRSWGDKYNENFKIIASSLNTALNGASGGDNLGSHKSTQTLNMNGFGIANSTGLELGTNLQLTTWMSTTSAAVGSGGGSDNLGAHRSTQTLNMNSFGISNATGIVIPIAKTGVVVIGTPTVPNALLHIVSSQGYTANLIQISTGNEFDGGKSTDIFVIGNNQVYFGTVPIYAMGQVLAKALTGAKPSYAFLQRPDGGLGFDETSGAVYILTSNTQRLLVDGGNVQARGIPIGSSAQGTAAVPSIRIGVGVNQGLYAPNNNDLGFSVQGRDVGHIDTNGNWGVGVGTPLAMAELEVSSGGINSGGTYIFRVTTGVANGRTELFGVGRTSVSASVPATGAGFRPTFGITFDGGGSALTAGVTRFYVLPRSMVATEFTVLGDQSGTLGVTVKANGSPPIASICASACPSLASTQFNVNKTLTGWTTTLLAGTTLAFNLDYVTNLTYATVQVMGQ